MQDLQYVVDIAAPRQRVWDVMLAQETYRIWTRPFSPDSFYVGEWRQGATIDFIDRDKGGTRAVIEEIRPPEYVRARHVAVLGKDLAPDAGSEAARTWVGTVESYTLRENGGITTLRVEMSCHEQWIEMFDAGWPAALALLKELCADGDVSA